MAGVTNEAFRIICKNKGAGLVYAEMVSDKGLAHENARTQSMTVVSPLEHPIAMQVFGSDYESITNAGKYIEENSEADIIDVNMGCPVNKVIKGGAGSALLKTPDKIYDIVKSLKDNVGLPVSIKIRAGFDHDSINCDEVTKIACRAGVDAIAIHGRTRSMMYRGESNNEYLKMVKENANCFVIGNGDIKNVEDAKRMIAETNVDAIMVGRASLGNPWIFIELDDYFNGNSNYHEPTTLDIIATMKEHAERLISLYGEKIAMIEMRTHGAWYFKRLPFAKEFRKKVVFIKTYQELIELCDEYILTSKSAFVKN